MHGHGIGRAVLELFAMGVVAAFAGFWFLAGRGQAGRSKDSD